MMVQRLFYGSMMSMMLVGCVQGAADNPEEDMSDDSSSVDMRVVDVAADDMAGDAGESARLDMKSSTEDADMHTESPPVDMADMSDGDQGMCSLSCPCGGYCKNGKVTILGNGAGWDGLCGQEPTCTADTYECANGCAQDAPSDEFYNDVDLTWCQAAMSSWQNFCAPE